VKNNNKWKETAEYILTYPGWLMVLVGFVTILAMAWPLMVYKFIYGPVIDEFGWSRTEATMLITWHWISAHPTAPPFTPPMTEPSLTPTGPKPATATPSSLTTAMAAKAGTITSKARCWAKITLSHAAPPSARWAAPATPPGPTCILSYASTASTSTPLTTCRALPRNNPFIHIDRKNRILGIVES